MSQPEPGVSFVPLGEEAIVAVFGTEVSVALNERACAFADTVAEAGLDYVTDVVPSFAACTVHYRALDVPVIDSQTPHDHVVRRLEALWASPVRREALALPAIEIPVCYGGSMGPDLEQAASICGMTADELVKVHAGSTGLRVFMIGFLPGAPYIGVHDARLRIPRRPSPRTLVPAGSVAIANRQSVIYPDAAPGGWNLIGRTPIRLFDETRATPALLVPGTPVRFRSIGEAEFELMRQGS